MAGDITYVMDDVLANVMTDDVTYVMGHHWNIEGVEGRQGGLDLN